MKQAIEKRVNRQQGRRWLIISGGVLLQIAVIALVIIRWQTPGIQLQGDLADHIVTNALMSIFGLTGIIIFLRLRTLPAADVAYGVFVCTSLIFCLLNISAYRESMIAMSLLSVITHALAATFACLLVFPAGWYVYKLRISPYAPLVSGLVLCIIGLPGLVLFSSFWPVTVLLTYVFPFTCMLIIAWSISSGFHRSAFSNQTVAGMSMIGIVFALLSLAIINGKSTPNHVVYLPSTVGFLVLYVFFAMCCALAAGMAFWAWRHTISRIFHILLPVIFVCVLLLWIFVRRHISSISLDFLRSSMENLFAYHLLSIPLLILPIICCCALIYRQLSSNVSLLNRYFIRSMLWFILASCFVTSEMTASVLAVRYWDDHSEIALACLIWLFLSCWLFPLLWGKMRDIGDRMFYRDFYHYNRTLRDLSMALTHLRDLDQICAFILPRLTVLLNAAGAALLVWEESGASFQSYCYEAIPASIRQERFKAYAQQAITHFSRFRDEPLLLDGILLLPLYESNSLRGCLCLAGKLNNEPYSRQDKSFLETLAAQLAVLEANTRYLSQVRTHTQQITALNHRIIQAQEEERRRLALELHDDVLQQAMLLTRQLTDLLQYPQTDRSTGTKLALFPPLPNTGDSTSVFPNKSNDFAPGNDPRLARSLLLARSVASGLRTTCLTLRPPLLDELGLPEALRWLTRQTEQQSGIRVMFQCRDTAGLLHQRLPDDVELAFYRVAQEALTNAMKHAQANLVRVRLRTHKSGTIILLIADNGHGLQRTRPLTGNLGLTGMRERMEAIGGRLYLRGSRGVAVRALYQLPAARSCHPFTPFRASSEHSEGSDSKPCHPERSEGSDSKPCHPERSEGSDSPGREILRFAQDDRACHDDRA